MYNEGMKIDSNVKDSSSLLTMFGKKGFDLFNEPILMGILNVTPDSFSDGGNYVNANQAVLHAKEMLTQGAMIIDIGGESTRPGSKFVSEAEEIARVIPVLKVLKKKMPEMLVSIDTSKSEVARTALDNGADMINDISAGTFDAKMFEVVSSYDVPICLMHTTDVPEKMQDSTEYKNLLEDIYTFLSERIQHAQEIGIKREKIIIDPGVGFGKSVSQNLKIVNNLQYFKELGCPVLVGTSRKSFIGAITGKGVSERGYGTAATVALSVLNGAGILRVHDVADMMDVILVTKAINEESFNEA